MDYRDEQARAASFREEDKKAKVVVDIADVTRLLSELEAAARDKIIHATQVANTGFTCALQEWRMESEGKAAIRAIFEIGGSRKVAEFKAPISVLRDPGDATLTNGLRDAVAKIIADEILDSAFAQHVRSRLNSRGLV